MSKWYIHYDGQNVGPMEAENLLAYNPTPQTMVWTEGMAQWQPIYSVPELMNMINSATHTPHEPHYAPGSSTYAPPAYQTSGKDKLVCGLLAILLGSLGIQYFYLGKIGAGLITIFLCFITCGLWSVLILIQGILMLTMSQQDFDQKYVYTKKWFPLF